MVLLLSVGLSGCISNNNLEEVDTVQVSVLSTERVHRLKTNVGFVIPDTGNDFFKVEIKVTNIGGIKEYTSIGYSTISDTTGIKYRPSPYTNILSDKFDNLDIRFNKYNQGKILFEIPINCTVAYFYYNDLVNNISLEISEPELNIPTEVMTAEEIYNEFNSIVNKIDNISLVLTKLLESSETNYTLVEFMGGDIVYVCTDYIQDILPLLPIPTYYEKARKEFNSSLLNWGQMGLYYIYYGYNQDLNYYNETITQKKIAEEHWVNCSGILGFS